MLNGETVIYVGNLYEKKVVGATTTHTKYYYFGGRRIAMRVAGTLSWLLSDHLGSTTVTADGATGARTAELWYKPWGESRGTAFGVTPTARRFTGQTLDEGPGGVGRLDHEGTKVAKCAKHEARRYCVECQVLS